MWLLIKWHRAWSARSGSFFFLNKLLISRNNYGGITAYRAFSAAECVESQWAIAGNPLTELSVQELISCVRKDGCSGGNTYEALYWLQKGVKCFIYLAGQYYYILCVDISVIKPWIKMIPVKWNDIISLSEMISYHFTGLNCPIK